jgi:type VI secretion system protein ImpC
VDTAKQAVLIDAVDRALSHQLRVVLQDSSFKRLEATWRSMHWLTSNTETGADLNILMVHVTKDELMRDMDDHVSPNESGLAHLLLESTSIPGGRVPALLVGNYEFDHSLEDLALLERIGSIAQRLKAPFVAAAGPSLLGLESFNELSSLRDLERRMGDSAHDAWRALRDSPQARWLALALPRVLCRLPYGPETKAAESFKFEETVAGCTHEELLWGNPAFRVAGVVAAAFATNGWSLSFAGGVSRLEGLPLYVYRDLGETVSKPCAEVFISERIVEMLEEAGLVPLVSHRDADVIALPCLQSLGLPRCPLSWSGQL